MKNVKQQLLLGDEAVALGAIHAGISGAYAYPGTPSTEILETVQRYTRRLPQDRRVQSLVWSVNEKTAYEEALGQSYAGRRAMVIFKHVGLNVAMDPFMSSAITGTNGGLVLVVADDPGMHSSQSEQDSRFLADFAQIPCLEPWDQQTAYEWTRDAFDLSEKLRVPVMLRLVTRLAHSRSNIVPSPALDPPSLPPCHNWRDWTLMPANARPNYEKLLAMQPAIIGQLRDGPYFTLDDTGDRSLGIIACGLARNYVLEAFDQLGIRHPLLLIGAYPIPFDLIQRMHDLCETMLVVEDGMTFIERRLQFAQLTGWTGLRGRTTGDIPSSGELTPTILANTLRKLGGSTESGIAPPRKAAPVPGRPPQLCPGCTHIDVCTAVRDVTGPRYEIRVFGDIGCYALGALPPYDVMETCVDMGASIPMAIGASQAGLGPSIAIIGDSTFTHSGMTGLVDAVSMHANIVVIIADNGTTAMTGGQPDPVHQQRLIDIAIGAGVDPDHAHLMKVAKSTANDMRTVLEREMKYDGPSVIVFHRPCIHSARQEKSLLREKEAARQIRHRADEIGMDAIIEPEEIVALLPTRAMHGTEARPTNIVLAGVGGQGILAVAHALSLAAVTSGMIVKQAETHGMSQRGGAVTSHVRYAPGKVHSDLVPLAAADILLAMEPLEALRWADYLSPSGHVVVNTETVENIPDYPDLAHIMSQIKDMPGHVIVDADRLASAAGSPRTANMVLLGAAAAFLDLKAVAWDAALTRMWSPKGQRILDANRTAFRFGRKVARFYRALIDNGIGCYEAMVISSGTHPSASAHHRVKAWVEALGRDSGADLIRAIASARRPCSIDPEETSTDLGTTLCP